MKSAAERFWSKVNFDGEGGCWLWVASRSDGYGRFALSNRRLTAHRIAYEELVGPIPEGLELDHLCRVRHCVNPSHMEPVTCRTNVLRGIAPTAQNARQAVCPKCGGEYSPQPGGRYCHPCHLEHDREYQRAKRKAAAR